MAGSRQQCATYPQSPPISGVAGLMTDMALFVWRRVPVQREEGNERLLSSYCGFYYCIHPCKLPLGMIHFCLW